MRYCTYCKVFYDETNQVIRHDDIIEKYERKGGSMKCEYMFQYTCKRCGSVYHGVP